MSATLDQLFKDKQQADLDAFMIYKKFMENTLTDHEARYSPEIFQRQKTADKAYKNYLRSLDRATRLFIRLNFPSP